MFEHTSRYAPIPEAIYQSPDGREIKYIRRRFLPQGRSLETLTEATVEIGDRIDLIAARTLGDAEQAWQICDANNAMHPFSLTSEIDRTLRIPIPQFPDQ